MTRVGIQPDVTPVGRRHASGLPVTRVHGGT
jgi:hypothetical protein